MTRTSSVSTILLKGGAILQHDANDEICTLRDTDLLIQGETIAKIGKNLVASSDTKVIDCHGKIVSPGFVDTHHHVWQTQLKGRHSDDTLLDYTAKGNWQPFNYTATDVFWGELGGLLESIDGGTTCIVDHAHMAYSPSHGLAGFTATVTSGMRSIYCLGITPRLEKWGKQGVVEHHDLVPNWFFPTLQDLERHSQSLSGKVSIGLGFDSYTLPREDVIHIFENARTIGAKIVTSHWRRNNIAGTKLSVIEALDQYGLLRPDIILSHATGSSEKELQMVRNSGAFISTTPATESQMAHGEVVGFRKDVAASIGADCHSNNPASLLHNMQVGLAVARSHRNSRLLDTGKFPKLVEPTTLQAFNLATINGARAVGLGDKIGSIAEGKAADIIIVDADTPAMCCAFEHDALVALVRHAGVQEINTVIVAGSILKENGRLVDVKLAGPDTWDGRDSIIAALDIYGKLSWRKIAEQLRSTRIEIQQRIDKCSMEVAKDRIINIWASDGGYAVLA